MITQENKLCLNTNILLCIENEINKFHLEEIDYLKKNFCGIIIDNITKLDEVISDNIIIYILGNIKDVLSEINNKEKKIFHVIKELSCNYDVNDKITIITLGEVPINVHNVGLFFRNFFNSNKKYFESVSEEHQFQSLTESNKPGTSYRKGLYLTKVEEKDGIINFNLLRCSTNLDGPTDNFRQTDNEIINKVNNISQYFFEQKTNLNHVLAQIYSNSEIDGKEKKAKIKDHSDKTKDMPRNGLIAFCTFYRFNDETFKELKRPKDDPYDYHYKGASVLTRLRFRLKRSINDPSLVKMFDVILYPNSVFMISLLTNRFYTHEIVPSHLPIDRLPIRLGYVIRNSKTEALFKDNQTYIRDGDNELIKLEEPSGEKVRELKDIYFMENTSGEIINYGKIDFSLNKGDYMRPIV